MAKNFEGRFNVVVNPKSNLIEFKVAADGKYTAEDAELCLTNIVEYAVPNKVNVNRWDFYIPDVNQLLPKDTKELPISKVTKAIKDGYVPTISAGKWGKPKMTIASPVKTTATKTAAIMI